MNGQIPQSGITFLKTRNLEETTDFYTEIMRFEMVLDQSGCRIFRICDKSYLGFCITEGDTGSEEVVITIEMQDVDGFYEYLKTREVEVKVPPRENKKYLIYQMFLNDPNGYLLEIQRFLDPLWSEK